MENISERISSRKEKFLKNIKEINSAFGQTTDRSKELTLLMTLYLMGEFSINSSPITTKQKNRLYNLLIKDALISIKYIGNQSCLSYLYIKKIGDKKWSESN